MYRSILHPLYRASGFVEMLNQIVKSFCWLISYLSWRSVLIEISEYLRPVSLVSRLRKNISANIVTLGRISKRWVYLRLSISVDYRNGVRSNRLFHSTFISWIRKSNYVTFSTEKGRRGKYRFTFSRFPDNLHCKILASVTTHSLVSFSRSHLLVRPWTALTKICND